MRRFVLVTATQSTPGCNDFTCAGIRKLKRGTTMAEFMADYLVRWTKEIGEDREELLRGETHVVISRKPNHVMQWTFTEYPEDDLLHAVKHLSREELLRDLNKLLPLKESTR